MGKTHESKALFAGRGQFHRKAFEVDDAFPSLERGDQSVQHIHMRLGIKGRLYNLI